MNDYSEMSIWDLRAERDIILEFIEKKEKEDKIVVYDIDDYCSTMYCVRTFEEAIYLLNDHAKRFSSKDKTACRMGINPRRIAKSDLEDELCYPADFDHKKIAPRMDGV